MSSAGTANTGPSGKPGGRGRRGWEPADTIAAGGSLLVATIVAIFVLLCFQGYNTTAENTRARAQRAAQVMAEGTHWVLAATLASLEVAATRMADPLDPAEVDGAFRRAVAHLPVEPALAIYASDGRLISEASSMPADISAADDFRKLADGMAVRIGVQQGTGEAATLPVYRRVERDGVFAGVVAASVPARALAELAIPQDLGAGSTVSVIRADGWIIARDPPLSGPFTLAGTPAMKQLEAANAGSYVSEASPADGVPRVVGFQHVDELGYIAVASIARDAAFAGLWNAIWIVSLLLAPFSVVLLIGSFLTASLLRRAQAASRSLSEAVERNEQLFREIHHRVKNNLQSVAALLQLHPLPKELRADLGQRILAMSTVHEHIYRSGDFSNVRARDYLHTLIANVAGAAGPGIFIEEDLEDVTLDKDAAGPIGLILNEVLSNCFKHAFPDGMGGTVKVSLRATGNGRAQLSVEDNGIGFDQSAPGKGIGRKLVAGFARQLNADYAFTSENGSRFVLTFPVG